MYTTFRSAAWRYFACIFPTLHVHFLTDMYIFYITRTFPTLHVHFPHNITTQEPFSRYMQIPGKMKFINISYNTCTF